METRLEVVFWDVGQGDCSTLQLPDGSLVIIDTGPRGSPLIDWLNDHPGKKIRAVSSQPCRHSADRGQAARRAPA
jgi:beta-lactamase superfamily II metal-dependent hydrolase